MERLAKELKKIIDARIDELRMNVSSGMLDSMEEYKKQTGQIEGLKAALELIEQAISNLNKQ
jgi:hypothetical protein